MTELDTIARYRTASRERDDALAKIERVKVLMDEDYKASLLLDQGHDVLMAAKADGMRLVVARVRAALPD